MKFLALSLSSSILLASYAASAHGAPMQQRPMVLYPGEVSALSTSSVQSQSSLSSSSSSQAVAASKATCSSKDAKKPKNTQVAASSSDEDEKSRVIEVVVVVVDEDTTSTVGTISPPTSTPSSPSSAASTANPAASSSESTKDRCAVQYKVNDALEAKNRALIRGHQRKLQSLKGAASHIKVAAQTPVEVPVYFNVINDDGKGDVSDAMITKQLQVINQDYSPWGFEFKLVNTSRVSNADWYQNAGADSELGDEMKTSLRQGGANALNLYTLDFGDGTLGYSTFPWDYQNDPGVDGVVFQYNTLPGGSLKNYNGGRTLTHEVGHWLGLLHTFQGGCASPGDYVDDTAPQKSPTNGCPSSRDSCSGDNLPDPIHNYMDYSYDSCMDYFSDGQGARMQALSGQYRFKSSSSSS